MLILDRPRGRRWARNVALTTLLVTLASACTGTWGIRLSYRDYITSPIAGGEITPEDGVTWYDGPSSGKGPFSWPIEHAAFDDGTETGVVQFKGGVSTAGHETPDGFVLDTSFWNPRLEIDGDTGTLIMDLNYRPYAGPAPEELPPLEAALDVPFATLDLSGVDWTPDEDGDITIQDAPATGITAAMELIGWDLFYGDPVVLDPFSVTFREKAPTLVGTPRVVVSRTTDLDPGDTVAVWGWGFDPTINIGTRPPLTGQPAGVYSIFGRFANTWQPSAGAPSSSRTVLDQKWALGSSSRALLDPTGTNPAFATIDQYGRFETTVVVSEGGVTGDYGVYVYPGSGAINANHEIATLVTLDSP